MTVPPSLARRSWLRGWATGGTTSTSVCRSFKSLGTLRMNEFFLASLAKGKADLGPPKTSSTTTDLPAPTELVFATDAQVQGPIKDAEARFDTLVRAHDLH
ncbi:hypothetical protein H0H87_005261, partial [Tephrocybe sp. NHM501043]